MTKQVKAFHLEKHLPLQELRDKFSGYNLIKREHSYLFYQIEADAFMYLKDYGSLVFINCQDTLVEDVLKKTDSSLNNLEVYPSEAYKIELADKIEVDFDTIQIKELTIDVAHIIMLNLAQSVALKHYVDNISVLHDKTLVYSKQLEEKGTIDLSKKQMRIFIGKTMNLKNSIAENMFIFDMPELAWNNEDLSKLDFNLKNELDIVNRHESIQLSLGVIKENLDFFKDILQHKYSSMLEWIIIILILLEVVQVLIEKIL